MTDQEWQEGIERALNAAWQSCAPLDKAHSTTHGIKLGAEHLSRTLPLRITFVFTNKDQAGHFRVGPARDEAA